MHIKELTKTTVNAHQLILFHNIRIVMQFTTGHSNIPGNDVADGLPKDYGGVNPQQL